MEAIKAAITPSSPRPWAPSSETHVVSVYGNDFDKASYECAMPTRTVAIKQEWYRLREEESD